MTEATEKTALDDMSEKSSSLRKEMTEQNQKIEQIIMNLRKIEVMAGQGKSILEACREIDICEQTYYRWRNKYGNMSTSDAKKLKELERENERLDTHRKDYLCPSVSSAGRCPYREQ